MDEYSKIKDEGIVEFLDEYANTGEPLGGFLHACVANDFVGAICQASLENMANLLAIAQYIYNRMPSKCWGSAAKVTDWEQHNGLAGLNDDALNGRR